LRNPVLKPKYQVSNLTDGAGVSCELFAAMCAVRYVWLLFVVLARHYLTF
jgi:hypothetical protein